LPYQLVLTTVPTRRKARQLAALLLEKKLAACINISSQIESHYWWNHKKERGREYLLFIKTKVSAFTRLERMIRKNHPYAVPEIIALSIQKGSRKYLDWLSREID